jgi:DNA topoisomerase-2
MSIEPDYYLPTVPLVLINGADGIGTGWSTNIPNYSPVDIVDNLRRLMRGEAVVRMAPWYRGFKVCSDPFLLMLGIHRACRTRQVQD